MSRKWHSKSITDTCTIGCSSSTDPQQQGKEAHEEEEESELSLRVTAKHPLQASACTWFHSPVCVFSAVSHPVEDMQLQYALHYDMRVQCGRGHLAVALSLSRSVSVAVTRCPSL